MARETEGNTPEPELIPLPEAEKVVNKAYVCQLMVGPDLAEITLFAPTEISAVAMGLGIVATNMPQITGFNLFDDKKTLLCHCPLLVIMTQIQPHLQKILGKQVLKAAIPLAMPAGSGKANLELLLDEAKKSGKQLF